MVGWAGYVCVARQGAWGESTICVGWSQDSKHVASEGEGKAVLVWDAVTGTLIMKLQSRGSDVVCVALYGRNKHPCQREP